MLTTYECLLKEDKDCMRNMCKLVSPDPQDESPYRGVHKELIKIKLDKSKKLWYNSCTKKETKSKQGKKQQEPKLLSKLNSKLISRNSFINCSLR